MERDRVQRLNHGGVGALGCCLWFDDVVRGCLAERVFQRSSKHPSAREVRLNYSGDYTYQLKPFQDWLHYPMSLYTVPSL